MRNFLPLSIIFFCFVSSASNTNKQEELTRLEKDLVNAREERSVATKLFREAFCLKHKKDGITEEELVRREKDSDRKREDFDLKCANYDAAERACEKARLAAEQERARLAAKQETPKSKDALPHKQKSGVGNAVSGQANDDSDRKKSIFGNIFKYIVILLLFIGGVVLAYKAL